MIILRGFGCMNFNLKINDMARLFFYACILLSFFFLSCSDSPNQQPIKLWTEIDRTFLLVHLERTRKELMIETKELNASQWYFQDDSSRWSIAQIIEHLVLQEEAYFRELSVIAASPERSDFVEKVKGNDTIFLDYATDPNPGQAGWYAEPKGRFCIKEDAISAFNTARIKAENLIKLANSDFRKQFTFRNISKEKIASNPEFYEIRTVRDLHQLVLNNIAHTDRHLHQIKKVKEHENYPK